ncbi:MAG: PD40 domain-containing protein [Prevotella sp.]|nr:PD40 domain-containing protein [Prevotella sp.]
MKKISHIITVMIAALTLAACNNAKVPDDYSKSETQPAIYPDYAGTTIPVNIAPLCFIYTGEATDMVTQITYQDTEILCSGIKAVPDTDEWKELLEKAKGAKIDVTVYTENNGKWTQHKPFSIDISPDSINPYISYRLIPPSYVTYEKLTINQRCLENFDESVIYDNMLCSSEGKEQCINCHSYQNYNPNKMQFHARQQNGGTIIAMDGKVRKINMKHDSLLSAGVYPAWHPHLNLIAYSTNHTMQNFHTRDKNKVEVFDTDSDVILFDTENNTVMPVSRLKDEMESFPSWSPDGKWLYYCSAKIEFSDSIGKEYDANTRYKDIKYSIYRKAFNEKDMTFGEAELIWDATANNKSATLPRISPCGNFLVYAQGAYGCFHVWHNDADLYIMDLRTMESKPMTGLNSNRSESYHSWSSNGRWMIFNSRRNDGNYTRPFIAHIDSNGNASKPFELPQADPELHKIMTLSYNVVEFMNGPVEISPRDFASTLKGSEGEKVTMGVER